MAGPIRLFLDCDKRRFALSFSSDVVAVAPNLVQGESVPFQLYFLDATGNPTGAPYSYADFSTATVKMAICGGAGTPTGTPAVAIIAQQDTWSNITNGKSGLLNMDTTQVAAFLSSSDQRSSTIEIEVTPSGGSPVKYISQSIQVRAAVIQSGSEVPVSVTQYFSKTEALATFVPKIGLPGQTITLVCPNGTKALIFGIRDDGSVQLDVIDPYSP
jgi:hypothetical protein